MLKKYLILLIFNLFVLSPLYSAIKKEPLISEIFYSNLHPFHISITEIKYNANQKSLEIAQKIFWDDLEVELNDYSKSKINFLKPSNEEELNKLVEKYILEHSDIYINGIKTTINYLGYEIEEDVAWIYMEVENIPVPKSAEIKNSVLFKNFPGQQNIINFYKDKSPKSLRLIANQIQGKLNF